MVQDIAVKRMIRGVIPLLVFLVSCTKRGNVAVNNPPVTNGNGTWMVSTLAGNGTKGYLDGSLANSSFSFPEDITITADGSLYVTDVLNHRIRKLSGNSVSTFAGNSTAAIVNGSGLGASFFYPYSICSNDNGNLYSTDENDTRIRKLNFDAMVTNFSGSEVSGFLDGQATVARFGYGNYVTAAQGGALYVSDADNNRIRKVNAEGSVTSLAGDGTSGFADGTASLSRFSYPAGIANDKDGNVFIADRGNFRIRKISAAGIVSTVAGTGVPGYKDGAGTEAQFSSDMRDLAIDKDGVLYLTDANTIRKITPDGKVSTIAGSSAGYADGAAADAKFDYPNGLAIDQNGNIYVADTNNNRIRKLSRQ